MSAVVPRNESEQKDTPMKMIASLSLGSWVVIGVLVTILVASIGYALDI